VRGGTLFRDVDYRLARTEEEREAIYALRYRAYLRIGVIREAEDKRLTDKHDHAPNSWLFGVYVKDCLRGSIRIHLLTRDCRESLCVDRYGDILHPRLDRGEIIIDAARFVGDPDISMPELPYSIMRLGFVASDAFNADTGLIACSPEHGRFYERFLLYKPLLAQPHTFPGITVKSVLIAANFKADREKVLRRYPILGSSAFERRMLFGTDGLMPLPAAA